MSEVPASPGGGLPELPQDVLLRVAGKLTTKEWLYGPAGVCQSLYRMPMPSMILELNDYKGVPHDQSPHNVQLRGMRWAAGRVTSATTSLEVRPGDASQRLRMPVLSGLTEALQSKACVSNLKVLIFEVKPSYFSTPAVVSIQALQVWIIERAPHIEALRLLEAHSRLIACTMRLQHLKHLQMEAHAFVEGVSEYGGQFLSCLETLFLHDEGQTHAVINVLGCPRLRGVSQALSQAPSGGEWACAASTA